MSQLLTIKEQNNQILAWMAKQDGKNNKSVYDELPDLPVKLPLESLDDLENLEDFLKNNNEHLHSLVCIVIAQTDDVYDCNAKYYSFLGLLSVDIGWS